MMSKTAQNFSSDKLARGQVVNYVNGIPVSELSPLINKNKAGKFAAKSKLPKIEKIRGHDRVPS